MTKLTTAAWVAHELGLAASFGRVLFGKLALNPNLDVVESKPDRGKLLNKAWNRYNAVSIDSGVTPAPEMSNEVAGLLRGAVNLLGNANMAVLGGAIAVSTILSMKANESLRWSIA